MGYTLFFTGGTDLFNKTIIYSKYVYRFGVVNERTLNALRENKLYFSTFNYYDDPFDIFINIDIRKIQDVLDNATQIHYTDQHKRFAVSYDLENEEKLRCGKQAKCANCEIHMAGTSLYPIYYSNEKYDATRFVYFLSICKMAGNNLNEELFKNIIVDMGNQMWEGKNHID